VAGKALSKRWLAVIVAVILAGVAALALISYVRGAKSKAVQSEAPVEVYVAKATIPQGTLGSAATSQGLIIQRPIPRADVAPGAVTSLTQIQAGVASADILQGEQIQAAQFVAPQALHEGLLPIPAGMQAMSVQVAIVPAVDGFIQQGDTISVIAQVNSGGVQDRFLLQDVQVLAVGGPVVPTASPAPAAAASTVVLTLALAPAQAEKLAFATQNGQLYLTLVPKGQQPGTTPGANLGNLFS
jgi:pilus assembly protein CpaB